MTTVPLGTFIMLSVLIPGLETKTNKTIKALIHW